MKEDTAAAGKITAESEDSVGSLRSGQKPHYAFAENGRWIWVSNEEADILERAVAADTSSLRDHPRMTRFVAVAHASQPLHTCAPL